MYLTPFPSFPSGVFDLGAGHPIVLQHTRQQNINKILKPYKNIILLMPTENVEESLHILRERNNVDLDEDFNTLYFKDKTFWDIAKTVVYTEEKTPEETCEEILGTLQ